MTKSAVRFTKEQIAILKDIAVKNKLRGVEVLNEFSDDEIADNFNGAGGALDPEWKRWILTRILWKKLPSIMIHDMQFKKGGSRLDFLRANDDLRNNIINTDGDRDSMWWNFVGNKAKEYTDAMGYANWKTV